MATVTNGASLKRLWKN